MIKYSIIDSNKTVTMTSPINLQYNQLRVVSVKANFNPKSRKTMTVTPIVFYDVINSTLECTSRTITIQNIEKC